MSHSNVTYIHKVKCIKTSDHSLKSYERQTLKVIPLTIPNHFDTKKILRLFKIKLQVLAVYFIISELDIR